MNPAARRTAGQAVIVISSHVVRGTVGNRAAVFALETLGFPVWAVPTVTLAWHPGHGPSTRIVAEPQSFAGLMRDLENAPWRGEVGAVLTGYLGHPAQVGAIASLIRSLKAGNPDLFYVCDPVIGDRGGLYVPEATATAIRDDLLPLSDLATPNRYELEWLSGRKLGDEAATIEAAREAASKTMLVTSAPGTAENRIANLLVAEREVIRAEHELVVNPPNGLGDLTAALMLAHLKRGMRPGEALHRTTASVFELLAKTAARGADELTLESDAASLTTPHAHVDVAELGARPGTFALP